MKRFWLSIMLSLMIIVLILMGTVNLVGPNALRHPVESAVQIAKSPNLFPWTRKRKVIVERQRLPHLKAPGDVSRETRKVTIHHPIHYHGYFNSKNKASYLHDIQIAALRDINHERTKRHMPKLKLSKNLNKVAVIRAGQANRDFNHYNRAGQALSAVDAAKIHVSPSYMAARAHLSECLSEQVGDVDNTAGQVSHSAVNGMIYHDAGSHWGHRKILLDPKNRLIGIMAYVDKANDNKVVIAYELYQ